jgi:hypothetical protein
MYNIHTGYKETMLELSKVRAIAALLHRRDDLTAVKLRERGTETTHLKLFGWSHDKRYLAKQRNNKRVKYVGAF